MRAPRPPFPLGPRRTEPLPQPIRHQVRLAGGDTIAWSELGDPDGPVLVAVHGFRGSDMGLAAVLGRVDGCRIICPNLPGMGVSPSRPGVVYDLERLADVVAEFIDALGVGPVWLLGHSYGSVVCTAAAGRRPELVSRLLLLAPIVDAVGVGVKVVPTKALTAFLRVVEKAPEPLGLRVIDSKFPGEQSLPFMRRRRGSWEQVQQLSHEALPQSFDRSAVLAAHRDSSGRGCREFAGAVSCPAAIVLGEADQFSTVAQARSLAAELGGAVLRTIPGAGHLMHYEHVDEVAAAVAQVTSGVWSGIESGPVAG